MDDRQVYRKERKKKEKIWAFAVFIILLFFITGLSGAGFYAVRTYVLPNTKEANHSIENVDNNTDDPVGTPTAGIETDTGYKSSDPLEELNTKVEKALNEMSLEEKVGQMFLVPLTKLNLDAQTQSVTDVVRNSLDSYQVGGVVFLKENISSKEQVMQTIQQLQENRDIPLFMAVTEESGEASVLTGENGIGFTAFANAGEIGASGDSNKAGELGITLGEEMSELGFSVNLGPVADANIVNNSILGKRSFGSDPVVVADMVREMVTGLQDLKISAVLKYFPGYGSASGDTLNGASTIRRSLEELQSAELLSYQAGIDAGADFIMVGHSAVPQVTGDSTPGSLSPAIVTDLLRNKLGYEGIIMTDELNKKAVSDRYNAANAAIKAVDAGVDILLMPASLKGAYEAVVNAVKLGEISEDRIDESVIRILKVKLR